MPIQVLFLFYIIDIFKRKKCEKLQYFPSRINPYNVNPNNT